eukprot:TRINITY_DN521_c0_g1_i1.p1 TRINITY_DN521_c0_g1~~TRINITY_DN521_c0_g1_i1.p1  ORF type:complete len:750 (+),score=309.69 TRINITY_DN521_c0_g1_i1:305-2251(+)
MAATFDENAAHEWGTAMGKEFIEKGSNVQLGPGVCVARVPVNGRNFEYISGEDPYLGYFMTKSAVQGIQSQGVIANAKHYINNNQETNRGTISEVVDERTRMEIYHPPFQGAVDGGVLSIMCSYNRVNGVYSCENNRTLNTELKGIGQLKGWVMSDWGATHSTEPAALAGLDQEMPGSTYFGSKLKDAVSSGKVPQSVLDDKVYRMLYALYKIGAFDRNITGTKDTDTTSPANDKTARSLGARSLVLVQNKGMLPLKAGIKKIAVIGQAAEKPTTGGGGSGSVAPKYQVGVLQALRTRFAVGKVNCSYEQDTDYYVPGEGASGSTENATECCALCAGQGTAAYTFYQNSCYCKTSTAGKRSSQGRVSGTCTAPPSSVEITYTSCSDASAAADAAAGADVAIVVGATSSHEGADRANLDLPEAACMSAVGRANNNTAAIVITPGAILTPYADDVNAVVIGFMPGQEEGNSVADVLFGDVEPQGRLPLSMPNKENEVGFTESEYPGVHGAANYSERLNVGYRWYTSHNVQPRFAFGHGLTYTSFAFSDLKVSGMTVTAAVKNTGGAAGTAVPQLYLKFPPAADEPPLQLKGFQRVALAAGEEQTVTFTLTERDLSIWSVSSQAFTALPGDYGVYVGASSEDLPLTGTLHH